MKLKDKTVLVTGADGFIGSHLVEELINRKCRVKAFVFYNSFNSWGWLDSLSSSIRQKLEVFAGDIRDHSFVENSMKNCDVIFHLAALVGIPFSYHSPESYVETNIKGTLNILSGAKNTTPQKVLITSTSEVYGTARYLPIDEAHPFQGQSPYSASKIAADRLAESFYRSFDLPITIVRPFNTYGPRQSARAIIPTIVYQILAGSTTLKLGNLTPTRDLNYVGDVVKAYAAIAECDSTIGEEINIATGKEISIGNLANKLIDLLNANTNIETEKKRVRPERSEVERLVGSNEKLLSMTDWQPNVNLDSGLRKTIRWLKSRPTSATDKGAAYTI